MQLKLIQETTEAIARQAGAILLHYFDQPHQENTKMTNIDMVTEADTAAEAVIVAALREAFPDHHIVGEEGGGMGAPAETADYFWYVDPLDGTTNYANNLPIFSVSMALAGRDAHPLVGVVYNPVADEMFSAVRGGGATLNGRPLQVSTKPTLQASLLGSGFPYDKATDPDNNLNRWGAFLVRSRGLRRLGSAALDMCYVASGRFDGYWEGKMNRWDFLAGMLCVLEAGGRVTDYSGGEGDTLMSGKQVLASNGLIHDQMLAVIREAGAVTIRS
ncbi:MAG: inositol monophosphatase [Anaerolineaceae bacterium]|nr:inositol monophosphatase [Anaerolineaceae bacterium]